MRLAVLLTGAMAASSIMQFAIGALGPTLTRDLHLSRPELGLLIALYFLVAAGLSGVLGRRIDALDSGVALAAVFAAAGGSLLLAAAAPAYLVLLVALVPSGAAAAAANPATNKVLAGLSGRRGALTGLKQSGVHLGALLAGGVVPPLAAWFGWRPALAGLGMICIAAMVLVAWLPERREARSPRAAAMPPPPPPAAGAGVPIRRLSLYALFSGAGLSAIMTFLPLYGTDRMDLGDTAAGMLLAVMALWGNVSSVGWGWIAERRARATGDAWSPLALLAACAVAATGLIAAAPELGGWSLWTSAVLLGLSAVAANGVVMLVVVSSAPAALAGAASGRVLTAFFAGLCVSGPVFGLVVDLTDQYLIGWLLTAMSFMAAVAVSLPLAHRR